MRPLPYVNVGPISDAQAKTLTIRANALRGEFDAIKLAELVSEVAVDLGREEAESLLPYSDQKIQAMIDMVRAGSGVAPDSLGASLAAETGVGSGLDAGRFARSRAQARRVHGAVRRSAERRHEAGARASRGPLP